MKKISCVGYHATGSGAVDDFLREFDNIQTAEYGIECRFLQDPDGISDLEHQLIENYHRLNSGFALKRFLIFAKSEERTYRHIFGNQWIPWAQSYVEALSKFQYTGYWHGDIRLVSPPSLFVYKARKAVNLLLPKGLKKNKYYSYFPKLKTFCVDISEEEFLRITRAKCEELCEILNRENREYVVLDQAVSPQNINRYLRYISDLQVIVVDRDPRDVYINDIVRNGDFVLPKDVRQFCTVYRLSRKTLDGKEDSRKVLRMNFEDMVYRYDATARRIMEFLGLNQKNHKYAGQYFKPEFSVQNTRQWERYPQLKEQIDIIEHMLPDMLYRF